MKVIVADPCGFCYGVKRAVEIAEGAVDNLPAATLGPRRTGGQRGRL